MSKFIKKIPITLLFVLVFMVALVFVSESVSTIAIAEESYTITFKGLDGNIISTQNVLKGNCIDPSSVVAPDIEHFKFVGWSNLSNIYAPFDFTYRINDDETIHAYYSIDYDDENYNEPTLENGYTVSVDSDIESLMAYQWYKYDVHYEMELFYLNESYYTFPVDHDELENIYLLFGDYTNYSREIYSEEDDEGDLPLSGEYKQAIQMFLDFSVNTCWFEFSYDGELTSENAKRILYDGDTSEITEYGTIEKIDEDRYRYTCLVSDLSMFFYLALDEDFSIYDIYCYYTRDDIMTEFEDAQFASTSAQTYDAGEYYCALIYNGRNVGKTNNITAYDVNIYFSETNNNCDISYGKTSGFDIGAFLYSTIFPSMNITSWKYKNDNGQLVTLNNSYILTKDIDVYPVFTLTENNLTNSLIDGLENDSYHINYKILPTGKYNLTEDLVIQDKESLMINSQSVVEICLNGHVINCSDHSGIMNFGNLKVIGSGELIDYYFDYTNRDWSWISSPTVEQKNNAITLEDYDPLDESAKTYKVIKVSGYGLIVNSYSYTIANKDGNSYYDKVMFVGAYSNDSSVISTSSTSAIYFKDCGFYGNKSDKCGGVVWAMGCTFDNCKIMGNYAGQYGGGIYNTDSSATIKGGTIIQKNVDTDNNKGLRLSNYMKNYYLANLIVDDDFCGSVGVCKGGTICVANSDKSIYFTSDNEGYKSVAEYDENSNTYTIKISPLHNVTFVTNVENLTIAPIKVVDGSKISAPTEIPELEGYTFIGWSTRDNKNYLFDFDENSITYNTTLYAAFAIDFDEPSAGNNYTIGIKDKQAAVEYYWYKEKVLHEYDMSNSDDYEDAFYFDEGNLTSGVITATYDDGFYEICIGSYTSNYLYEGSYFEFTYEGNQQFTEDSLTADWYFELFNCGTLSKIGENRYKLMLNLTDYGFGELYIKFPNVFSISDVKIVAYFDEELTSKTTASLGEITTPGDYYCEIYYNTPFHSDLDFCVYTDTIHVYAIKLYSEKDAQTSNDILLFSDKSVYDEKLIPTKTGYSFLGWYFDDNGNETKLETTDVISKDMTLYAKFAEKKTFSIEEKYLTQEFDYDGTKKQFIVTDAVYGKVKVTYPLNGENDYLNVGSWSVMLTMEEDDEYKAFEIEATIKINKIENKITYSYKTCASQIKDLLKQESCINGTNTIEYYYDGELVAKLDDNVAIGHTYSIIIQSPDTTNYYSSKETISFVAKHVGEANNISYEWGEGHLSCKAKYTCGECGEKASADGKVIINVSNGYKTFTAKFDGITTDTQQYKEETSNGCAIEKVENNDSEIENVDIKLLDGEISNDFKISISKNEEIINEPIKIDAIGEEKGEQSIVSAWNIESNTQETQGNVSFKYSLSFDESKTSFLEVMSFGNGSNYNLVIINKDGTQEIAQDAQMVDGTLVFTASANAKTVLIVATESKDTTQKKVKDDGLSAGAIAGIVIGCIAFVTFVTCLIIGLKLSKKKKQ